MSANESATSNESETSRLLVAQEDVVRAVLAMTPQQRSALNVAVRDALLAEKENNDGWDVSQSTTATAAAAKSSGLIYNKSIHSIQYKGREIGIIKKEGSQFSRRPVAPHQNGPLTLKVPPASPTVTSASPHQNQNAPPTLSPADPAAAGEAAAPATNLTDAWAMAIQAGDKKVNLEGLKRALGDTTRTQQQLAWEEQLLIYAVNETCESLSLAVAQALRLEETTSRESMKQSLTQRSICVITRERKRLQSRRC